MSSTSEEPTVDVYSGATIDRKIKARIQRGTPETGLKIVEYDVEYDHTEVVLDLVHRVQALQAPDLAVRWNCKAGKCGSCSAEINGQPKLMCMTKMSDYDGDEVIEIRPMRTFPVIKDLVTDVSWNYEVNRRIKPFKPPAGLKELTMKQEHVDRIQEFRKCIECYLCQNVCHVLRTHDQKSQFAGPRFMIRLATLQMHPMDQEDNRLKEVKDDFGVMMCNITKCCTEVCPEHITITDNGIIPLKERVIDKFYDPLTMAWSWVKRLF